MFKGERIYFEMGKRNDVSIYAFLLIVIIVYWYGYTYILIDNNHILFTILHVYMKHAIFYKIVNLSKPHRIVYVVYK
jgi:hypothetical protein